MSVSGAWVPPSTLLLLLHADSADSIDPTKDHTRAMKMLEDAGIYVILVSPRDSLAWE
jgi:hypothetical protein